MTTQAQPKLTRESIFAKAKGKTAAAPTKGRQKETVWAISPVISDTPTREQLNTAVSELIRLQAERKQLETEESIHKGALRSFAEERYVDHLATVGVEPESPLKIINDKMQSVTFVVQDRGHLCKVTDEQIAALADLLGEDAVNDLLHEGGEFKFDTGVMGMTAPPAPDGAPRTVQDVVAEALTDMLADLAESGKLTPEQADSLISFSAERRFKPKVLSYAVSVCGRNRGKLAQFLDVLGPAVTRYVKT